MVGRKSVAAAVTSRSFNGNEDPPPSTYAAQLVQQHAPDARSLPEDASTTFAQLLHAILHSDIAPETDADINYRVIRVVTDAGLEALPTEDPFAAWDVLIPQAVDSIAVIETTLRRQPGLLLLHQAGQNANNDPAPMLIWLFASLIKAAKNHKCGVLKPHIERILVTMVDVLANSLEYWQHARSLLYLYQDATDEILRTFDNRARLSHKTARSLDIKLPAARSFTRFTSDSSQAPIVSSASHVTLNKVQDCIDIASLLSKVILASLDGNTNACASAVTHSTLLKWTQDSAIRIRQVIIQNRKVFESETIFNNSATQCLSLILDVCSFLYKHESLRPPNFLHGQISDSALAFIRACFEQPLSTAAQDLIAEVLQNLRHSDDSGTFREDVAYHLHQVGPSDNLEGLGLSSGLKKALQSFSARGETPQRNGMVKSSKVQGEDIVMEDVDETRRPQKDPRDLPQRQLASALSKEDPHKQPLKYTDILRQLLRVFGEDNAATGSDLSSISKRSYRSLNDNARESAWNLLALLPCISAGTFEDATCEICYNRPTLMTNDDSNEWKYMSESSQQAQLASLLRSLISLKEMQESPRCRTLAACAIRSYVIHCQVEAQLDLRQSALGEWCFRSLTSHVKDLQISASRAIAAFLRTGLPEELRNNNRRMALDHYRTLSERGNLSQCETMIHAWGQVVVVCGDRERNLALLQLVDYLGHTNHFISSLAADELEHAADAIGLEPSALCRPFLSSLAVSAVRDVASNPKKVLLLTEFMRTPLVGFLRFTQSDTVPYLVLTKKIGALERIAATRGSETTIQDVIMYPNANLVGVLALLLSQTNEDPIAFVASVLTDMIPECGEDRVVELILIDAVSVIVGMLKYAGEEDSSRKADMLKAIKMTAILYENPGKSRSSNLSSKASKSLLSSFFENHILGIMTQFSETIEDASENTVIQHKIRCLKGIEEMINLARSDINIAVPQIRACLRSAIDQGDLVDPAISAWLALMGHLDADDVVPLLDHLFSIIVQQWPKMSPGLQQRTYDTVAELLKTQNDLIRDEVITVPSLAAIPLMSKFDSEISRLKASETPERLLKAFVKRLQDENASIVLQAARELFIWLENNQMFIHESVISEPPASAIAAVTRALLDTCVKYNSDEPTIADTCSQCLGAIGCLDPNRIEANSSENQVVLLSNFDERPETIRWVAALLERIFVPAFRSATNARRQGFLAFAMQEMNKFCCFEDIDTTRLRSSQSSATHETWLKMPENVRNTLIPFLSSRYVVNNIISAPLETHPIFNPSIKYNEWIRKWVHDMLRRGKGDNAQNLFPLLARVIMNHDISIPKFLLPYVALNIVLGGIASEAQQVGKEMLDVLSAESTELSRQCSEDVFSVLDYMSRWMHEKRLAMASTKLALLRAGHPPNELEEVSALSQISSVEAVVAAIPAQVIAQRAIECGSYARALFHWENHIREQRDRGNMDISDRDDMYRRLQTIYSEIDEPDGMEGIAAQISMLTPEQQAHQNLRAGRWSAAQSWYDIELANKPDDHDLRIGLLTCLQRSGQPNQSIRVAKDLLGNDLGKTNERQKLQLLSFVMDGALTINDLKQVSDGLRFYTTSTSGSNFSVSLGSIVTSIDDGKTDDAAKVIMDLRSTISRSLTAANSASLAACHNQMLQLHILYEVDQLQRLHGADPGQLELTDMYLTLDKRLEVLGSFTSDQQTVLAVRRALLKASRAPLDAEIGKSWLMTARLARKADVINIAHSAVLNATRCGDSAAVIEQARLMWKAGQQRQAIQTIQKAIESDVFVAADQNTEGKPSVSTRTDTKQNMLAARANLLLAKWLDDSAQSQTMDVMAKYRHAATYHNRWEKGHYYLGKHYNKILEANLKLPTEKREDSWQNGEAVKAIVENFLRSMPFGCKYWHQTLPKLITLWLGLGMDCMSKPRDLSNELFERRKECLSQVHAQLKKYFNRVPRYAFYTALPQLISRISHPNPKVADVLALLIGGVVSDYPAQALWALLPVAKASLAERASRGKDIISKLRDPKSRRSDASNLDMRAMVLQGTRLQDGLLFACEVHLEGRSANASLSRDLGFSPKLSPNPLVVPFQQFLTPNIPTVQQDLTRHKNFKPFGNEKVTIASFSDEVLVLNSLQRPRKLTLRGSDGKLYSLLCKPKDDLRKDQRLMEFNTMINRALKRSPETSKRHLYIKTYGVTPLSEESGTIEWVEGIKPLRDILLKLYQRRGITPNYNELRTLLNEASSHPSKYSIFSRKVLPIFPPVLHEWFTELFPSPATWFASRLRFSRSSAVMSMVGHILGLGDRHGENILLEESSGGVFHVDFNCLFDKGLTFEKPELVPFRLTHNITDALGPVSSVDGPFRRAAELVIELLRANHDAQMNVLETFLHDPTTDFLGKKKRPVAGVPDSPQAVLDFVSQKLRGYLRGESVPLSDEGLVQALISQATDEGNLCRMYIGWCAFL